MTADPERILQMYADVSARGRHRFNCWLSANAVLGSLLAVGIFAMAIAGLSAPNSHRSVAKGIQRLDMNALQANSGLVSPHRVKFRDAHDLLATHDPAEPF